MAVLAGMVALVLLLLVEAPVLVEVPTAQQRPEAEYGFGTLETPACPRDVEAVADEVPARPLDDAGRDGESSGEVLVVVHVRRQLGQVFGAPVGGGALRRGDGPLGGAPPDGSGELRGLTRQKAQEPFMHPRLGLLRAL